jgi:hypothetical protein
MGNDQVDAWSAIFIRAFMMDDANRSDGVRYNPSRLIEADHVLGDYLSWLMALSKRAQQNELSKEGPCDTTQLTREHS